MKISIVTAALNEAESLPTFLSKTEEYLNQSKWDYEVIVVDDGSTDSTWEEVKQSHIRNPRVLGLRLLVNTGQEVSLYLGAKKAKGDVVITMDCDLQHPVKLISEMVEKYEAGSKVVHAVKSANNSVGIGKRLTAKIFYLTFNFLSEFKFVSGSSNFRLIDAKFLKSVLHRYNHYLPLRALLAMQRVSESRVYYAVDARFGGISKYNFNRMLKLATELLFAISLRPLRISLLMIAMAIVGNVVGFYLSVNSLIPSAASQLISLSTFMIGVCPQMIIIAYVINMLNRIQNHESLIGEIISSQSEQF